MELISLVLLIIILIFTISIYTRFSERLLRLESEIQRLKELLLKTGKPLPGAVSGAAAVQTATPPAAVPSLAGQPILKPAMPAAYRQRSVIPAVSMPERDLEKFIGEKLVSKIGIVTLVLAIAFFVKYAIDKDWIGPVARVGIGLLCGALLTALAHYIRNSYKAFSSVLLGGALAVFYFTITLAYQQYALFSQPAAFVIMIFITAFAVVLSVLYNRQELAVIALTGGFATPFMVSNGNGDYVTLFIYLLILNTGLLVLAFRKNWRILNLLAFIFTILLFSGWFFTLGYNEAAVTYRNALLFATGFFLMFFTIYIASGIREQQKLFRSDIVALSVNAFLYFILAIYCLTEIYAEEYTGLFCMAFGGIHLGLSWWFLKRRDIHPAILYLLTIVALVSVTLAGPLQLSVNKEAQYHFYRWHYALHWLGALCTALFLYRLLAVMRRNAPEQGKMALLTALCCTFFVIFLTAEIQLIIQAFYAASGRPPYQVQTEFIRSGWSILWGLCSFLFMWLGMKYRFRALRIVSLVLFFLTLLKLFTYDIRNISEAGKIAAFFSLGVLLLVVSFMYQRLKKIIIDHEEKNGA